ncbi:SGNH hydrolase [Kribbella sandramycini]|uniref:SGNH hydrolase n=1 Tax=Kribbella sandramycini TaxID=60450 RepID=A0A7Y4NWQ5_9ACTN|nr:LamG-like jellyroll fold domain-containing protein [Kribbella sandramycini]MBB6568786.1 hypothetical protein [Kribbella sandramycini]NOL38631.1 SGNH hydrolase [Kribbella sandramycini]
MAATGLVAALVAGVLTPTAAVAKPASPAVTDAVTEAAAVRLARETGKPVQVQEKNTQTSEVLANPSGTFTLRSNARPVRVQQGGKWRGIDTTLKLGADGTVAPVAAAVGMTFSGGGDVPMVSVAEGKGSVTVHWPGKLPEPTLAGNTATYAEVLPGVDLKLIAEADTYIQTLVVRDAAAAKNPALAALKLNVTAQNLALKVGNDGRVTATGVDGKEVFVSSAARMWDSESDPKVGPSPTAATAGGAEVDEIRTTAKATASVGSQSVEMLLTPDAAALTGPDVKYPLYIDPHFARNRENWTEVTSNPDWSPKWRTPDPVRVGRCYNRKGQCGGTWTARSYFNVWTGDLKIRPNGTRPKIFSKAYIVGQLHSSHNCENPEPTQLWAAGDFNSGTRWGGPAARYLNTQWSNAQVDCGGGRAVKFDPGNFIEEGIDNGWNWLNFGLIAPQEDNDLQWKVFDNNPVLEVEFAYPPNKAYDLRVSGAVNCNGKIVTPEARPAFFAKATDNNDPPLNPALWFHVWTADEKRDVGSGGGTRISSGTEGGWREPNDLGNGDYKFRVYVDNNPGHPHNMNAGYSDWFHFTTRSRGPAVAPTVEPSADYPKGYWGTPYGAPGNLVVNASGASNIVGYTYTFNGSGTATRPGTTSCAYNRVFGLNGGWIPHSDNAPNVIPIPATMSPGFHTVHVQSFDDAHNLSPESAAYTFYVAPQVVHSAQRLEAENLIASQPAGQNRPITQHSDDSIGWSGGKAIRFVGNAVGQSMSLAFDTAGDADWNLSLGMSQSTDVGKMIFELDGRRIGDPTLEYDGYNVSWQAVRHNLGVHRIAKGSHLLTIRMVGTNPKSLADRYTAQIDYLTLSQTTRSEAEDPAMVTVSQPPTQAPVPIETITRGAGGPAYSRGQSLGFLATEPNKSFDLSFRTRVEADYALGAGLARGPEGGLLEISVDGKPLQGTRETPWDAYAPGAGFLVYQPLGGVHLTAGVHKLTIKVTGKNAASTGYKALVDYLTAIPINKVTAADFGAAMNNDGIAADGTKADLDLSSGSLSAQSLAAAGYGPGATVQVNGATFTMPEARADGADNVIAIGQTIPFPAAQQVKSTAISLLAAATCGNIPAGTATINYADGGSPQDSRVPGLTDWVFQETAAATAVLPYRNVNGTPAPDRTPRLTVVSVPTDPTRTVKSITLPNYGTNMLPGGCSPALHVLAMAPRPVAAGWLGAWSAPADAAKPTPGGVNFANQTVRTVVRPKVTGGTVRIRVANPHTNLPVTIGAASIGVQSGTGAALTGAPTTLAFGGRAGVTLPAGGEALSDPVAYPAGGNLAVSLYLPNAVRQTPVHQSANRVNEPTLLANGNATADSTGTPFATLLDGATHLAGVQVSTDDRVDGTVAVLGDQLTAVPPAGSAGQTWVDQLAGKLADGGAPLVGGLVNASQTGVLPSGLWSLADGSGSTARDTAGSSPLSLAGGATWSSERGGSLAFDGTGTAATAPRPPFLTDASYTVSLWVKVTGDAVNQSVIDAEGNNNFGFKVWYTGGANPRWAYNLPAGDVAGGPFVPVISARPAVKNTWTHLVISYDAAGKSASLWIDNAWEASGQVATVAGATKRFVIGRDLRGLVSDVRAYQAAAGHFDVNRAFLPGMPTGIAAPTAFTASQYLERTVQAEPNLRTVVVSLGANDLLTGMGVGEIKQSLTRLMHTSSPTSPRHLRRPDGNAVRIVVTTIPPLGLAAEDPREQRRRELNADLLANFTNYGANHVVDIDAAVSDGTAPNRVRPEYLTDGLANGGYHDAIAQTIADAATVFPPKIQL